MSLAYAPAGATIHTPGLHRDTLPSRLSLPFPLPAYGSRQYRLATLAPDVWQMIVQQLLGIATVRKDGRAPEVTIHMLSCFLDHVGPHSDLVWVSEEATEVWINERVRDPKASPRTQRRAKPFLRDIGLRTIDNPDERAAGPGPELYPQELHRGDGQVTIWDLGGLFRQLPAYFVEMLEAIKRSWQAAFSGHEPEPASKFIGTFHAEKASELPLQRPDPPPPLCNVPIKNVSTQTQRGPGGKAPPVRPAKIGMHKIEETRNAGPAGNALRKTKIASGLIVSDSDLAVPPKVTKALKVVDPRVAELRSLVPNLYASEAAKWIRESGVAFCRQLVEYGRWEGARRGQKFGGGWLNVTRRNFLGERRAGKRPSWPDDFVDHLKRLGPDFKRVHRSGDLISIDAVERKMADEAAIRRVVTSPKPLALPPAGLTAAQQAKWVGASDFERPAELLGIWSKFLLIAEKRMPRLFHWYIADKLVPLSWHAGEQMAVLLCATPEVRQKLTRELATDKIAAALGDAMHSEVSDQPVRVRLVDEIRPQDDRGARRSEGRTSRGPP